MNTGLPTITTTTAPMRVADKSKVHGVGGRILRDAIPSRDRLWIFYPRLLQLNLLLTGAIACNFTNGCVNVLKINESASMSSTENDLAARASSRSSATTEMTARVTWPYLRPSFGRRRCCNWSQAHDTSIDTTGAWSMDCSSWTRGRTTSDRRRVQNSVCWLREIAWARLRPCPSSLL